MDPLDIARWQFAITTVYHFLFVPVSIGLSAMVAGYEIAWLRTKDPRWLRLTRFFGKLFLINFATAVELAREVLAGHDDRAVVWITHSEVEDGLVDRVVDLGTTTSPARADSSG